MRYPASEKLEIIRLVERSHLPAKQTLDMLSIPRTTIVLFLGISRFPYCFLDVGLIGLAQ